MPPAHASLQTTLEQRIGSALLRERQDEGLLAIEGGRVVACSRSAADLLGWDAGVLSGLSVAEFVSRLDSELLGLRLQSAMLEDAPVEFVAPRPRFRDGWIKVRSLPLAPGVAFLLRDVTQSELSDVSLRRKEQRLLAANRSLRLAHVAAHAASWEWRGGRSLRWLDLAAARELGCLPSVWTEEEEIPDWRSIVPPAGKPAFDRCVRALAVRGHASFEVEVVGADNARHWMRIECAVTERDAGGGPVRVSGVTMDVTAARRAGEALRDEIEQRKRSEERQQTLLHELNHRVKNMLATVQSIARQSLKRSNHGAAEEFEERLMALAWAYEIVTREQWAGASLRELIQRTLAPHVDRGSSRLRLEGPDLWLTPNRALSIALAMHELATNAVKHGALSNEIGRVAVGWRVIGERGERRLALDWTERDGPPVKPPPRRGFGSRLIERSLARELQGEVTLSFEHQGLSCRVIAPLSD
jgi:two-component sensor histidine kinase